MWVAPAVFFASSLAIYSNTWSVPFVFDDTNAIEQNSTIRDLTKPVEVLLPKPRGGATTDGRPLLNLSLALNYAVSGLNPWSYHVVNVGIHFTNSWLLFCFLRRIFTLPVTTVRLRESADVLGFCIALLWLVHPLQTAAITYVIQRAEAIMALFYLSTLYCFLRAAEDNSKRSWTIAAIAFCWIGQGAKEIMATAPLAALALDAALIAGSFKQAFRQRGWLHLLLFASWLPAAALILHTGSRSGTVGFGGDVSPLDYFVAQCGYLLRYLALVVWPWPQVFDYGMEVKPWDGSQWAQVLLVVGLIIAILVLWVRRPTIGLLGLLPMLILAPTSSFIPVVTHVAAEHRMYLPLAAALTTLVLLAWMGLMRLQVSAPRLALLFGIGVIALGLGLASHARNRVFASHRSLWSDSLRAWPDNMRVRDNLALSMAIDGHEDRGPALFDEVIAQGKQLPQAYSSRARAWMRAGEEERGIADFKRAIAADSQYFSPYLDLSVVYRQRKEWGRALEMIEKAIQLKPSDGGFYMHRGIIYMNTGRPELAERDFHRAIAMAPYSPEAHLRLGELQRMQGRRKLAIESFERALYYSADYGKAELALVNALAEDGDYRRALALVDARIQRNDDPRDWVVSASVFEEAGDMSAADRMLAEAIRRHPLSAPLRLHRAQFLARIGRFSEAVEEARLADRLQPGSAEVAATIAGGLLYMGDLAGAASEVERALKLEPGNPVAQKLRVQLDKKQQSPRSTGTQVN